MATAKTQTTDFTQTMKDMMGAFPVDTAAMAYNPVDEKGYQWVQEGDDVVVSGHLDSQFWKEREVMDDTVIEVVAD